MMVAAPIHRTDFDALRLALEGALGRHFGGPQRIRRLHRRRSPYSSSYAIDNLVVDLDDGTRLNLIHKDLSPAAVFTFTQHVRPQLLYRPLREIEVYEQVLRPGLGTPFCYGSVACPRSETFWLFLERVAGRPLWQCGQFDLWKEAARWLAAFHNEFGFVPRGLTLPANAPLLEYDSDFFTMWLERAEEFLRRKDGLNSVAALRPFSQLADRFDTVIEALAALPRTFVHGEFYPSNILVRPASASMRICPVDWEMAGVGPALLDLAALTSGKWNAAQKRAMVQAYHDAAEPNQGWPLPLADLLRAVEFCQLQMAIQWLGWADAWSPPAEHAQDWLREAARLAEKLDLAS